MQDYLNIDDFEQAARFRKRRCGATGKKRTLERVATYPIQDSHIA